MPICHAGSNSAADEQGLVQGALFGAQSLAQAIGGVTFSTLYVAIGDGLGGSVAYAACDWYPLRLVRKTISRDRDWCE